MLPYWLIASLISVPCTSDIEHSKATTVVYACSMPQVQGPPRPPIWWRAGMFDNTNKALVDKPAKVLKYNYTPKKKKKVKRKKRK